MQIFVIIWYQFEIKNIFRNMIKTNDLKNYW